jgi:lysophospholipase L1-like esterase
MMKRLSFWLHGPLLPLLVLQGKWTRGRMPMLPEATGARCGDVTASGTKLSLAVLGESTAVGVGAASQDEALAFCLARSLARKRAFSVQVQVVGETGATIRHVRNALVTRIAFPVDAVVIALGVNDTLHLTRGETWASDLRALISDLKSRGASRVVFSGLPPLGSLPALPQPVRSALGARAAYLDALLQRVCAAQDAHYIAVSFPYRPELMAEDGFHPSALGYTAWADELAEAWPLSPSTAARDLGG